MKSVLSSVLKSVVGSRSEGIIIIERSANKEVLYTEKLVEELLTETDKDKKNDTTDSHNIDFT